MEAERGGLEAAVLAVEGQLAELLAAQGQQLAAAWAEAAAQQAALGAARGEWAAERAALMGQQEARQAQWGQRPADSVTQPSPSPRMAVSRGSDLLAAAALHVVAVWYPERLRLGHSW